MTWTNAIDPRAQRTVDGRVSTSTWSSGTSARRPTRSCSTACAAPGPAGAGAVDRRPRRWRPPSGSCPPWRGGAGGRRRRPRAGRDAADAPTTTTTSTCCAAGSTSGEARPGSSVDRDTRWLVVRRLVGARRGGRRPGRARGRRRPLRRAATGGAGRAGEPAGRRRQGGRVGRAAATRGLQPRLRAPLVFGLWTPGQEDLIAPYLDRYLDEAPADRRSAARRSRSTSRRRPRAPPLRPRPAPAVPRRPRGRRPTRTDAHACSAAAGATPVDDTTWPLDAVRRLRSGRAVGMASLSSTGSRACESSASAASIAPTSALAQACPSNILVTDPSSKTSLMACESSGRDRQARELVEPLLVRDRQRVGDHDLGHRRCS